MFRDLGADAVAWHTDGFSIPRTARPCLFRRELKESKLPVHDMLSTASRYPENIPSGTAVPAWAYLDVRVSCRSSVRERFSTDSHPSGERHL